MWNVDMKLKARIVSFFFILFFLFLFLFYEIAPRHESWNLNYHQTNRFQNDQQMKYGIF